MKATRKQYQKLFLSTFTLSAFTFGGGFAIVPLMRRKFVDELHWIEETEMLDLIAIAQSSPGAIAVNAAILVGYHVGGFLGVLLTVLGTILPPLIIISAISFFYESFRDNAIVNMVMKGMLAGVAAVIASVVITMIKELFKQKRVLPFVVLVGAFAAVRFLHVNILWIILVCAIIGAVDTVVREKKRKSAPPKEKEGVV